MPIIQDSLIGILHSTVCYHLHFISRLTLFCDFPTPNTPTSISFLNQKASPICDVTILDPTDKISVDSPPLSLSHSLDLSCVGAQSIMFLGRFVLSLAYTLGVWWAKACEDMVDFRLSQKHMS